MNQVLKGSFITLISPDGGGKDTAFATIIKNYPHAIPMYEPGGTKEADVIREVLLRADWDIQTRIEKIQSLLSSKNISDICASYMEKSIHELKQNGLTGIAEAYLYAGSRAETNQIIIIPTLQKGGLILSRRSVACSMSYQGYARELGMETIWDINKEAMQQAYPTLEIYIDVPADVAQERLQGRTEKHDRLDKEDLSFHEKTVIGYRKYYQEFCPYPYIMVDGTQGKEELAENIASIIKNHLKKPLQ